MTLDVIPKNIFMIFGTGAVMKNTSNLNDFLYAIRKSIEYRLNKLKFVMIIQEVIEL